MYKTAEDGLNKAGTNDYLGMFFAILAGICVAFIIVEHVKGRLEAWREVLEMLTPPLSDDKKSV
jgi:hypothetical protein